MSYTYLDMKHEPGLRDIPGFKPKLYFVPKSKIKTYPTIQDDDTDSKLDSTYVGDFTFVDEETKFTCIEVVADQNSVIAEPQGNFPYQTVIVKLSVKYGGTGFDASSLQKRLQRDDVIYILEDHEGHFSIIGHKNFICKSKVKIDPGKEATGDKGTTIEAECTDYCRMFYDGKIPCSAGDANPPAVQS